MFEGRAELVVGLHAEVAMELVRVVLDGGRALLKVHAFGALLRRRAHTEVYEDVCGLLGRGFLAFFDD